MGVVYEALDRERNVHVALKTLRGLGGQDILQFKREFRALADVQHPNLISLGELYEHHGQWFFSMELVRGAEILSYVRAPSSNAIRSSELVSTDTLAVGVLAAAAEAYMATPVSPRAITSSAQGVWQAAAAVAWPEGGGPYGGPASGVGVPSSVLPERRDSQVEISSKLRGADEERVRSSVVQLADALASIHAAGKVHRDIKPSNILVTKEGRVVLLDFGLVADTRREVPEDARFAGTIPYMAPESLLRIVGPEGDWYAVGVLLYEMLTARLPYDGPAVSAMWKKQVEKPIPPRALSAGVPEDLERLCLDLLEAEPARRPRGAEILERLGRTRRALRFSSAPVAEPLFVGRREELGFLEGAFAATSDRTVTVLVRGESGIGKTALVRAFTDGLIANQKALVVAGRCHEREAVPYKGVDGVIDALCQYLSRLDEQRLAELIPDNAPLLPRMFPVLRRIEALVNAPAEISSSLEPHVIRAWTFEALRDLLRRLAARQPLVVVIDDLQWADADSIALLAAVLHAPTVPMLLVATLRSREVELPGDVRNLRLGPLRDADALVLATQLVERTGGLVDPASVVEGAAGHPMFMDELARHARRSLDPEGEAAELTPGDLMGDTPEAPRVEGDSARAFAPVVSGMRPGPLADHDSAGPPTLPSPLSSAPVSSTPASAVAVRLGDALRARISLLPREARRLLEVVSLAGAPLSERVAAEASLADPSDFHRCLALLRGANLVRTTGVRGEGAVETNHDRIREAVLASLDEHARIDRATRLAKTLEATGCDDPESLSSWFRVAGDRARASRYAEAAARRASGALAFDRAVTLFRTALEILEQGSSRKAQELRVALADALANAGRGADAAEAYLSCAATADEEDAHVLRRRAADELLRSGHIDAGLDVLVGVLGDVGLRLPRTPAGALASALFHRGRLALRGNRYVVADPPRGSTRAHAALLRRADATWSVAVGLSLVDVIRGADFQARAMLYALDAGDARRLARSFALASSFAASEASTRVKAPVFLASARALAAQTDDPVVHAWIPLSAAMHSLVEGRFREALAFADDAFLQLQDRCTGVSWELTSARSIAFWSLGYMGDIPELRRRLDELFRETAGRDDRYATINVCTGAAHLTRLAADDPAASREDSARAIAAWSHRGFTMQHLFDLFTQSETSLYEGDPEGGLARYQSRVAEVDRSLLTRVQIVRIFNTDLRGRLELACAARATGDRRGRLLVACAGRAAELEAQRLGWASAMAHALRAGIAVLEGQTALARDRLERCAAELRITEMALHLAVVERALGRLAGGERGEAMAATAEEAMRARGIVDVARWSWMLLPGGASSPGA